MIETQYFHNLNSVSPQPVLMHKCLCILMDDRQANREDELPVTLLLTDTPQTTYCGLQMPL